MFTTMALVAFRDCIAAPCPHCGGIVLVKLDDDDQRDHAAIASLPHGTGRCHGCTEPLTTASIRIPDSCWQDDLDGRGGHIPKAGTTFREPLIKSGPKQMVIKNVQI